LRRKRVQQVKASGMLRAVFGELMFGGGFRSSEEVFARRSELVKYADPRSSVMRRVARCGSLQVRGESPRG
jgi:hypothetical protein